MKRVASLYLPDWSIDRVRRAERQHTPSPDRGKVAGAELAALKRASDAEHGGKQCDAPRNSGWRPGARWARSEVAGSDRAGDVRAFDRPLAGKDERAGGATACWAGETRADVEQRIARMEAHQRPPMREMGRRSEAAEHAFKRLPGDDGNKASGWPEPAAAIAASAMASVRFGGEGVRPTSVQRRRDASVAGAVGPSPPSRPGLCDYPDCSQTGACACDRVHDPRGDAQGTGVTAAHAVPRRSITVLPHGANAGPPCNASACGTTSAAAARVAPSRSITVLPHGEDARASGGSPAHDPAAVAAPTLHLVAEPGACAAEQVTGSVADHLTDNPRATSPKRAPGCEVVPATEPSHLPAAVARLAVPALRSASATIRHPDAPIDGKSVEAIVSERPVTRGVADRSTGGRIGSNDAGASVLPVAPFFDTGRSTAGTVARVCPPDGMAPGAAARRGAAQHGAAPHAPLVTVHKVGSRVEVAAACPAARALGVEPGMALTQVRAATPDIAVRDADPAGDRGALDQLATALARRWSPCVAVSDAGAGDAGLFIDLTGVAHLHGGERRMAGRIVRLLARLGFAARVGIADTPAAAWALARYDAAPVAALPAGHGITPFADHPVAALRLEPAAIELMRRLGIDRVGQLAAMPRAPLARRFGRGVTIRIDQLIGAVAEPVDPVIPHEPVMVEQRFAEPIMTAEPIAHWMALLGQRLSQALGEQGHGARALVLALTRVDGEVQAMRIGFARATRDPRHMLRLLARRIELIDPGFGIEIMALHVTRSEPLGPEALAGDLEQQVPDLAVLVDTIINRIGAARLWRTRAIESDVPERSVAPTAPLDQAAPTNTRAPRDDVRQLDRRGGGAGARGVAHPWHPRWPRPARLLRRPEPIDHVMAELPDSYPRRFRWRGQMHQVVRGDGPERITGEWWRRVAERQAVRDYFQVEDEAGQRFWLFRRGDGQHPETGDMTWYVHGTFG